MDKNNLYEGLIQKQILIIRKLRPSRDHQTFIKKQPDPSPDITKASDIFLIPRDDEMVQHVSLINKSGPQDIFLFRENNMGSNTHTKPHA